MTRHRKLLPILALLSLSALATCIALPFTKAQAQDDLLPRQQAERPRSILPPPRASAGAVSTAPADGGADCSRGSSDRPGQPCSPSPSENPPASANVMTQDASRPPPGQTWGPPPPEGAYSSNEILDGARSFFGGASEGLAKVVEYSLQQKDQSYSPSPSENPPASANVMTPDASRPPRDQTWGPVVEYSFQRKVQPNAHASLAEPIDQNADAIKALKAYIYGPDSGAVLKSPGTRGDGVH